jgi:hypothetical protein
LTKFSNLMAATAVTLMLAVTPASAQLLGGLLGGGDSGGGDLVGGVVDSVLGGGGDLGGGSLGETIGGITDTVIGDQQGNGIVQDVIGTVGLSDTVGNGQLVDLDTSGNGQIGVTGVLTAGVDSDGGLNVDGVLLGGGGGSLDLPLPIIGGGVGIELPGGLGDIIGGGGQPGPRGPQGVAGLPGAPGIPGINGNGGNNGNNGVNGGGSRTVIVRGGGGGGGGGSFTLNSSRLKMLARILQNRAWLRFAQGNKICLPQFGVANVSSWVKPSEYAGLQQLIAAYSSDIATLQQMMKRCRNGQNRMVDASRVIGIDFKDGQLVVMTM